MRRLVFLVPLIAVVSATWDAVYQSPYFSSIASDAAGEHLIAISYDKLVISSDHGGSWDVSMDVQCGYASVPLVMSANGQYAYFINDYYQSLYFTKDFGATWTFITDANTVMNNTIQEDAAFVSVATDASGSFIIASIEIYTLSESVMISEDFGQSWHASISQNRPYGAFHSVYSTGDGMWLAAVLANAVYISADRGATWTVTAIETIADYDCGFEYIVLSASGQYMYIGGACGEIYRSEDFGVSWSTVLDIGGQRHQIESLTVDSTGQYLSAVQSKYLMQSVDFGLTWECAFVAPYYLYGTASDASGQRVATVATGNLTGAIYMNY